jgi:small subunit ribosomal protein S8
MMITDPIGDMLTRIRNASAVRKSEVIMPMSKMRQEIAKILKAEGWIYDFEVLSGKESNKNNVFAELRIVLKYKKSGRSAISNLKRISKPGLKVYVSKDELPKVLNNLGMAIISTSQGLMTNKQARKMGVGGEVLCEIY